MSDIALTWGCLRETVAFRATWILYSTFIYAPILVWNVPYVAKDTANLCHYEQFVCLFAL